MGFLASMDGNKFFPHVISKEKSCDQDGLNQARVRSVCKTKNTFQTLSVRVPN